MQILKAAIARAQRTPNAPAMVAAEATLTWHEYIDTAARIAVLFERAGVRPGQVVAISAEFSPIMQTVLIAATWYRAAISCIAAGRVLEAPPFPIEWIVTPDRATAARHPNAIVLDQAGLAALASLTPVTQPVAYPNDEAVCHLVLSSGTTGRPKAIPFTLARVTSRLRTAREVWLTRRPFMSLLSVSAISGFVTFTESLRSGAPFRIPGDAAANAARLSADGVRALTASPVQLAGLADELSRTGLTLPDLEWIVSVGSTLPNRLRNRVTELTGAHVVSVYGSSEVGGVALGDPPNSDTSLAGRVLDGVEVQIVDADGQELADGRTGTIRVRGAGQPTEYFRDQTTSREAFVDGWFLPGDLGYLRDGELYVQGRASELLNAAGAKLIPSEIEQALIALTGVDDAAIVAETDELGITRVLAAYVGGPDLSTPEWAESLRTFIGDGAPSRVVRVAQIPRNENGKIKRQALAALLASHKLRP